MSTAPSHTDRLHIENILRQWYPWNYAQPATGWAQYVGVPDDWVDRLGSTVLQNPYFFPEADSRWVGVDVETLSWALQQTGSYNPAPYGQIYQSLTLLTTQTHDPPAGFHFVGTEEISSEEWGESYDLIALGYGPNASGRITYHLTGDLVRVYSKTIQANAEHAGAATMIAPILGALTVLASLSIFSSSASTLPARRRRKS